MKCVRIMRIVINRGKGIWKWFNKMALIRAAPYGNYDFNAIRTANTYIARVDECDMSEELKVRTKAEARFF